MDLSILTPAQMTEMVTASEDKDEVRAVATHLEVTFSGNSGLDTLKAKVLEKLKELDVPSAPDENHDAAAKALADMLSKDEDEEIEVAQPKVKPQESIEELLEMDETKEADAKLRRRIIRAKALRLIRVQISNADPKDAAVPGALVTCFSKYTNKVQCYVPFGEENEHGWHLPKIIVDDLKARTFTIRKEIKRPGSSFGVKEYRNVRMKKFNIVELEPLTPAELKNLAAKQAAEGSIDRA